MKVNFGLVAGIKAMPLSVADVFECCHFTHYFWGFLTSFWQKHFPILYWNKLIQGGNALWIKYVFLNQAKRLWHFYTNRWKAHVCMHFQWNFIRNWFFFKNLIFFTSIHLKKKKNDSISSIPFPHYFVPNACSSVTWNEIEIDAVLIKLNSLLSKPAFGWARLVLTWCW